MKAARYATKGLARDVLIVGEQPDPVPQSGEVLVRIAYSSVNPSDVKSRSGGPNPAMEFPRVIPHSDGAGVTLRPVPGARFSSRERRSPFAQILNGVPVRRSLSVQRSLARLWSLAVDAIFAGTG
jgi:hypothetical protein